MSDWQTFIAAQNSAAEISDTHAQKISLDDYTLIRIGGEDALEFLQNLFSNDVRLVNADKGQINSWSNAKGRMFAVFRLFMWNDAYYLLLPTAMRDFIQQRLVMFVLRAKVTLENLDDEMARFVWIGDSAPALEGLPLDPYDCHTLDGVLCVRLEGPKPRFLFIGENEPMQALWQKLPGSTAGLNAFRLAEIDSAVPTIWPQTKEAFVLQMTNLEALGGVSFKKGCYPGQEVVARMHYLGKLKRRMYLAEMVTNKVPEPGAEIVVSGSEARDGSGQVVDAIAIDKQRVRLLFVAQIEKAEADQLQLLEQPEVKLERQALPYSLDLEGMTASV